MAGRCSSASEGVLDRLCEPGAVAVVGSVKPGKIGHQLLTQLVEGGFPGALYAVNPGSEAPPEFPAVRAAAAVSAVPRGLDLALIAVPAAHALSVVEECGRKGVGAAVVFTSGFGEVGRVEEERILGETARRFGLRLVGPNCAGIMNTAAGLFASIEVRALPGRTAFITQSGAVGGAVLALAETRGIGFSKFVSYGNRADVGEVDLLEYLAGDPETELIALYLESLQDGREFMAAVRRTAAIKPVVIIKGGRSQAGLRAAGSHTGSLAGSDRVFEAMVHQSGALRVPGIEEMLDLCYGFTTLPLPQGENIAIVTNSGGPGILTSDRTEELGLHVRETSPELRSRLAEFLPGHCALANPIDLTVEGTRENYRRTLEAVLAEDYDGVIAINVGTPFLDSAALAQGIIEAAVPPPGGSAGPLAAAAGAAPGARKPVAAVFMAGGIVQSGCDRLAEAGIPVFPTGERAAYVLARMREYSRRFAAPIPTAAGPGPSAAAPREAVDVLQQAEKPLAAPVLEPEAVAFLETWGLSFPEHAFLADGAGAAELEAAAARVGLPLVMKVVSPEILHKSDVGGVALGLDTLEGVRKAYADMRKRFAGRRMRGVLLYRQLCGGLELIAGLKQDPDFGPVVLAGAGGVLTELLGDVAMRIAPFDRNEALAMLAEMKAHRLLQGFRGQRPRDVGAVADLLTALSRLGLAHPEIAELDLNPVFVFEQGALIADARILLR